MVAYFFAAGIDVILFSPPTLHTAVTRYTDGDRQMNSKLKTLTAKRETASEREIEFADF